MPTFSRVRPFICLGLIGLLLAACSRSTSSSDVRIELPQQYNLPQNTWATRLEKRVGRIAVVKEDGNIVVMDQAGENQVNVTQDATRGMAELMGDANGGVFTSYAHPVWSPDGQKLALVEITSKRSPVSSTIELNPASVIIERDDNSAIVEPGPAGQQVKRVQPGTRTEIRPDLVYIQRGSGSGEHVASAVYVASADGKRPLKELYLSEDNEVSYVDWSPNGDKLAFLARNLESKSTGIYLVNSAGGKPEEISTGVSAAWNWHPDGNTLLTMVGDEAKGVEAMNLLDVNAKSTQDIPTTGTQSYISPAFSPDGKFFLYTEAATDGKTKLILSSLDNKQRKTLIEFAGQIIFSWSPAGAKLAYVTVADKADQVGGALNVMDVNTGVTQVLTPRPVVAFFWSPDGTRIATFNMAMQSDIQDNYPGWVAIPSGATSLMLLQTITVDTKAARQLLYFQPTNAFLQITSQFDRYARSANIWSPDSLKFVIPINFGRSSANATGLSGDIVLEMEASGSIAPRILTQGGSLAFWSPK